MNPWSWSKMPANDVVQVADLVTVELSQDSVDALADKIADSISKKDLKFAKDTTVLLGDGSSVLLDGKSTVKVDSSQVADIKQAITDSTIELPASTSVELSEQDALALQVSACSSLVLVLALCLSFGFLFVNKLVTPLRLRHA